MHFFRQNFSQVTNPPIDSLRENEVMSLKTRFGNTGNILDFENLTKDIDENLIFTPQNTCACMLS